MFIVYMQQKQSCPLFVHSEAASPFSAKQSELSMQWFGPKRITPNPLDTDHPQLPRLDFVVVSHDHYDHR
jgi:L-ascorbate metabolism protein UlaG (beta-lactamase superfamily)